MNLSFLGISAHQNIRNISDDIPRNDAEIHQSAKALQNYKMQTLFNQNGYTHGYTRQRLPGITKAYKRLPMIAKDYQGLLKIT